MFLVVPNARNKFGPALVGALVAATLWEAGKWGLTLYLRYSTGYAQLYGSIALILLFFVWIHATWTIVLFGLSISYHLQHGRYKTEPAAVDFTPSIVDPATMVSIVARLARGFEKGESLSAPALGGELGIQPGLAREMLTKLAEQGYARVVVTPGEPSDPAIPESDPRYMPARPADLIDAESVLTLGESLAGSGTGAGGPIAESLRRARHEWVRGKRAPAPPLPNL
jgi:membrane protein